MARGQEDAVIGQEGQGGVKRGSEGRQGAKRAGEGSKKRGSDGQQGRRGTRRAGEGQGGLARAQARHWRVGKFWERVSSSGLSGLGPYCLSLNDALILKQDKYRRGSSLNLVCT